MIGFGIGLAVGVVFSETIRRLWNKYVAPKVTEIESVLKDK